MWGWPDPPAGRRFYPHLAVDSDEVFVFGSGELHPPVGAIYVFRKRIPDATPPRLSLIHI